MGTKFGFQIESGLTSEYLTDSRYIKDSYYAVANLSELNGLKVVESSTVSGSMCFVEDARTSQEIISAKQPYGKYFKYDVSTRTWQPIDASDIQLNDTQNLDQVLPKVYNQSLSSYIPMTLLTQEEYDELKESPEFDEHILYLIYREDDIKPIQP